VLYHHAFLSILSLIYFQAFVSYYLQYPGLNSTFGVEPVNMKNINIFGAEIFPNSSSQKSDNLNEMVDMIKLNTMEMDVDTFCEMVAFVGGLLSLVCASGLVQHGLLFFILVILYYFLTAISGVFYSFQWDILLLETGFLTALCYAPWLTLRLHSSSSSQNHDHQQHHLLSSSSTTLGTHPIRLLLFKLMFMSGVVKIQSNCPTWSNLTALEYHFATQCLPSPLSWHVHQMHPFILRLGVAITFIIEIPVAFLLVSPIRSWRIVGAYMQILLQILIIVTGNYNFFNVLTILLCLPCFVDDYYYREIEGGNDMGVKHIENDRGETRKSWQQVIQWGKIQKVIKHTACVVFLLWSCHSMIQFDYNNTTSNAKGFWRAINVRLKMTKSDCDDLINQSVPFLPPLAMFFLVVNATHCFFSSFWYDRQQKNRKSNKGNNKTRWISHAKISITILSYLFRFATCLLCMGVLSVPLITLTPELQSNQQPGLDFFIRQWSVGRSYRIFNGYGLFRRMTGVGQYRGAISSSIGWAGLHPSIVARPEIILETVLGDDESDSNHMKDSTVVKVDEWRELNFRWKPGNVHEKPRQVAPHQPRLDWQMWFAALGQYQHNPWLIHLMDKILNECRPVLNLLDEDEWMSSDSGVERPQQIRKIRARLFNYDFTRIDTEWSRSIPGVDILGGDAKADSDNALLKDFFSWPDQYWSRSFQREYVPILERGNPSVIRYLSASGYKSGKCIDQWSQRCDVFEAASNVRVLCNMSSWIRDQYISCNVVAFLIIISIAFIRAKTTEHGTLRKGDGNLGDKVKNE